jgi:hypothetical protein
MHIAICIKGVHYINEPNIQWSVDFHNVIDNYYEKLYNYYINNRHHVDVFISTYNTKYNNEIVEKYNPKNIHFSDINLSEDTYISQINHTLINFEFIKKHEEKHNSKYDFIINTRFDLQLNINMDDLDINYDNFYCFYGSDNNIDDSFWMFPRNKLDEIQYALSIMHKNFDTLHQLSKYIDFKIYFLFDKEYFIKDNKYSLIRCHRNNKKRG